jgi:hypothetical protein
MMWKFPLLLFLQYAEGWFENRDTLPCIYWRDASPTIFGLISLFCKMRLVSNTILFIDSFLPTSASLLDFGSCDAAVLLLL